MVVSTLSKVNLRNHFTSILLLLSSISLSSGCSSTNNSLIPPLIFNEPPTKVQSPNKSAPERYIPTESEVRELKEAEDIIKSNIPDYVKSVELERSKKYSDWNTHSPNFDLGINSSFSPNYEELGNARILDLGSKKENYFELTNRYKSVEASVIATPQILLDYVGLKIQGISTKRIKIGVSTDLENILGGEIIFEGKFNGTFMIYYQPDLLFDK